MKEKLQKWLEPTAEVRMRLMLLSALLIGMGLAAGWLMAWDEIRTALLFAPSNMRRAKQNWDDHSQILNAVIAGNGDLAALLASLHVHNAAKAYAEAQQPPQQASVA